MGWMGVVFFLAGCGIPVVQIDNNVVESPLRNATGITTQQVMKAAHSKQLSLWDVYALAVKRTESLAIQSENIQQAYAQRGEAIGDILPHIELNGTEGGNSKSYTSNAFTGNSALGALPYNTLYFSGAETILSGLNQIAALEGASDQITEQTQTMKNDAAQLLLNIANAFYSILELRSSQKSEEDILQLTQKILRTQKAWAKIGRSQQSDVYSTEAQLDQTLAQMESIKDQLVQAWGTLSALAGIQPDQPLIRTEHEKRPPLKSLSQLEAMANHRPDVQAAEAANQLASAQVLQAEGQFLPSLSVVGDYYLEKTGSFPSPTWDIELQASIPIFTGGVLVDQAKIAESQKRQAELNLHSVKRLAMNQIREAYQSLLQSIREKNAYAKALTASRKDYQAVLRDFHLNLMTTVDLMQTLTNLETVSNSYVQSRYQVLYDQIWLKVETGQLPIIPGSRMHS